MVYVLSQLLARYGSLYLTVCDHDTTLAGVLYALCCRSFPTEWVPIYARRPPFFEYETLLEEELGKKAILTALTLLHARGLLYRAWYDGREKVIHVDEGVHEKTLPPSTRDIMRRYPFPTYFVQVRHMALIEKALPNVALIASASFARIEKEYHLSIEDAQKLSPRDQEWFYRLALGDVQAQVVQWGKDALYISASLQAAMLQFLRQQTTR